jgi:hypothetical protein
MRRRRMRLHAMQRRSNGGKSDKSRSASRGTEGPGYGMQVEDAPSTLVEANYRDNLAATACDYRGSLLEGKKLEGNAR